MASYMHDALQFLFPKNCFEELFMHHNFLHEECSRLVLSRVLGLGIIVGSVLVKVPQILKIAAGRSGVGVSLSAQFLELLAVTSTMAYSVVKGFPFSSWGEAFFLAFQTSVIVLLILHFGGRTAFGAGFGLAYVAGAYALCSGVAPYAVVAGLQAANIPITVVAKAIQIHGNYSLGSTGQLSAITIFLMFAGSLARIFTTIQETGDQLVLATYVVASAMNGLIFAQILIYWGVHPRKKLL